MVVLMHKSITPSGPFRKGPYRDAPRGRLPVVAGGVEGGALRGAPLVLRHRVALGGDLPLVADEVVDGEVELRVVLGAPPEVGSAPVADDHVPRDEPEAGVEGDGDEEGGEEPLRPHEDAEGDG